MSEKQVFENTSTRLSLTRNNATSNVQRQSRFNKRADKFTIVSNIKLKNDIRGCVSEVSQKKVLPRHKVNLIHIKTCSARQQQNNNK